MLKKYFYRPIAPFLGKIAVNKAIDFKRSQGKFYEKENPQEVEHIPMLESETPSPEDLFLDKERRERVSAVAASLPEIYNRTLKKYYFEGKTYREIALEEGVTVKAIESRLYRAKGLFKENWGRDES